MPKIPLRKPLPQEQPTLKIVESVHDFIERVKRLPQVYFDRRDGTYWIKLKDKFDALGTRSIAQHMIKRGLTKDIVQGIGWRQCDFPCLDAEENNAVDYAGPLAGHRAGLRRDPNGKVYLITEEAKSVWEDLPKNPDPVFFREFIEELLPGQWHFFCHWLALALQSLRNGDFKRGQAIILAGPAQCGKSLLQYIITQILGGRSANPFKYMKGETNFNFDLIKAEHWMIEDPPTSTDIKTRREFGERLKECCNNFEIQAHKKNKDGEFVMIFRRITMSINNETEHLALVPPLDEGMKDKVFLFKCEKVVNALNRFQVTEQPELKGMPAPMAKGQQDELKIRATVQAELPAIRAWLLRTFSKVPAHMVDRRFGILAWQHPELLQEINSLAPEERLLSLIDSVLWDADMPTKWEGKSMDLEQELRKYSISEVERLFRFSNACGAYLGKLLRRHPERVSNRKHDGYTVWTILPPSQLTKENNNGIQE